MRHLCLFILLLAGFAAKGQIMTGTVLDAQTGKPMSLVTIVNTKSQVAAYSDDNGYFAITADNGDKINFSYVGYSVQQRLMTPEGKAEMKIIMIPMSINLKELTIHPDYTPYQQDSIQRRREYSKELDHGLVKSKFTTTGNGIGVDGLIGNAVEKMSKSYKEMQHFKADFKKDEEQKFIDTRYTQELVHTITGYSGDTLAYFMNTYPMEYQYARTASDLEIKMWIKYNYKQYARQLANGGNVYPVIDTANRAMAGTKD